MSPLLLALIAGLGVLMIFIGLARTPSSNTAAMVQQRLSVYGGESQPVSLEEMEQTPASRDGEPDIDRHRTLQLLSQIILTPRVVSRAKAIQ